jgi:hypothetical protein
MGEHTVTAAPRTAAREFPARPEQVGAARAFVRAFIGAELGGCAAPDLGGCPVADDAILCVSELCSNSVLHSASRRAGGTFTVRAELRDGCARVEVADAGGPWVERAGLDGLDGLDGRPHGLDIVRAVATESGVDGDAVSGWVVWARLDWAVAGPAAAVGQAAAVGGRRAVPAGAWPPRGRMTVADTRVERGWFQRLQAYEDAIAYRRARVAAPCPDCGNGTADGLCDEHARDVELIAEYRQTLQRSAR